MDLTRTAYGTWSGGRFMHFGEPLDEPRFTGAIQHAYQAGIRTFVTADVYGSGEADRLLGQALAGVPRDSYCLVGMIGHDFYTGTREGSKGFPRFTAPALRGPDQYGSYLRMATEKSLERCGTDHFDALLLHNPDLTGYSADAVWDAMHSLKDQKLAEQLGVAPGPANGFTLDLLLCFERFGPIIDWAMIILNPLEPWPGSLCLAAAESADVKILARVVDHGGLFHGDVKPGHAFGERDHRTFRPAGWVEAGCAKIDAMRPIAERNDMTLLQFACAWNLSQSPVASVVPTMIQEAGADARPIESKIDELANLPDCEFTTNELAGIRSIGDNTGCMELKGANLAHQGEPLPDRWSPLPEHLDLAAKWGIDPEIDLACKHA